MMEMMQEAGFMAYAIFCLAVLTHPLAIASAIVAMASKRRGLIVGLASASALLTILTVCLGPVGYWLGMQRALEAVANADSDSRTELLTMARGEALNNIWCGLLGSGLPALATALALIIGMFRKPA